MGGYQVCGLLHSKPYLLTQDSAACYKTTHRVVPETRTKVAIPVTTNLPQLFCELRKSSDFFHEFTCMCGSSLAPGVKRRFTGVEIITAILLITQVMLRVAQHFE